MNFDLILIGGITMKNHCPFCNAPAYPCRILSESLFDLLFGTSFAVCLSALLSFLTLSISGFSMSCIPTLFSVYFTLSTFLSLFLLFFKENLRNKITGTKLRYLQCTSPSCKKATRIVDHFDVPPTAIRVHPFNIIVSDDSDAEL